MNAVVAHRSPQIRIMTEADLDVVMEIEKQCYPFPWTRGIFKDCLRVNYHCWVYEQDGCIQAYGVISVVVSPTFAEAHILNLCVRPEKQGAGIAHIILTEMLKEATRRGADTVLLEVRPSNRSALRLYEGVGFVEIGVRKAYYPTKEGREDAVMLARHLEMAQGVK